ncbi:hypothetical protein MCERE10_02058 [Burkholderiaceae bacterium]
MSCICIAGSNQLVLDLVAKVLKISGMNLLVGDEPQSLGNANSSYDVEISKNVVKGSILPHRLSQVTRSAHAIEPGGWADTSNLDLLTEWLRIEPSLCFVLVSSKLTNVIAQAIDDYENAFDCLQIVRSWQQSQQKLLHFFYRHRDRCVLVDSQDCLENAQDFVRECKQRFSVPLELPKDSLLAWQGLQNPVALYFSKSLLDSYPEALSLENELATCVRTFSEARDIFLEVQDRGREHLLLREYRAQRQRSQDSLKQLVEVNTTLLEKIESIQSENRHLFNQHQKSQLQNNTLSEEVDADRKAIAMLKAELEHAKTQITEADAKNDELSKKNDHLIFDLYEAQRKSELTQELNIELEARVNVLEIQENNSRTLADLRQVDLDQALEKNVQLQEKQVDVEAENDILLSQFQQSLIDLESFILKNSMLQSQIGVEQEGTNALESRLSEVLAEYRTLDQAHMQWRAEREILIEQIECKQNAIILQNEESERTAAEHQSALTITNAKLLNIQQKFVDEVSAKQALETQVQSLSSQIDALAVEHHHWLAERKTLIEQIEFKQSALELQRETVERLVSALESLELEKLGLASRLLRLLQKYPMPVVFERLEVLEAPVGDQLKAQWQLVGLDTGKRSVQSLLFATMIEGTALGFCFSRHQASANGFVRWPGILATAAELVVSSVGDATTGPARAETWLSLATSDLETLMALSLCVEQDLNAGRIAVQFGEDISKRMSTGLEDFKRLSSETRGTFRYDRVRLKRATVNDDYEHLWFEFENVSFNDMRSNHFELRVSCSELISKRFGSFPKLEFPYLETQQPLRSWFAESRDNFGEKLELRFALPELYDVEIWRKLSREDQAFIVSVLERLPTILRDLELDLAELHRPWSQWQPVVECMGKCLSPTIISEPVVDLSLKRSTSSTMLNYLKEA